MKKCSRSMGFWARRVLPGVVTSLLFALSVSETAIGQDEEQTGVVRMRAPDSREFPPAVPGDSGQQMLQPTPYWAPPQIQQYPSQSFGSGPYLSMPGDQWCPPMPYQAMPWSVPSAPGMPSTPMNPSQGQVFPPGSPTQPGQGQSAPSTSTPPAGQTPSQPSQTPSQPQTPTQPTNPAPGQANTSPQVAQSGASRTGGDESLFSNMTGDFFGGLAGQQSLIPLFYGPGGMAFPEDLSVVVPRPGDVVGRIKFGENNSPIPRDRVIMDYSLYDGVGLHTSPIQVQRYTPGLEKTFFDGNVSLDVRLPFATTMDTDIVGYVESPAAGGGGGGGGGALPGLTATSLTDPGAVQLGNLSLTAKFLLHRDQNWAVSAGVQGTLPTADDVRVFEDDGTQRRELFRIQNESYHVMPFFAAQYQNSNRLFTQCFVQGDFDTTGSPVLQGGTGQISRQKDTPFLYVDMAVGYWLYKDSPVYTKSRNGRTVDTFSDASPIKLTGIVPRFELHYNQSLGSAALTSIPTFVPAAPEYILGAGVSDFNILNMTLGASLYFGANKELAVAWGRPLTGGIDSEYSDEVRIMFNYFLGPPGRSSRQNYARR